MIQMRIQSLSKKKFKGLFLQIILFICSFIFMIPLLWALSSSFKPLSDIFIYPVKWIPRTWTIDNYINGLQAASFSSYFFNSILVSIVTTISVLFLSSMTAFGLSQFTFPGKKILFAIVVASLAMPLQVRVIPLYLIIRSFGWINTYAALIVPYLMTSLGIVVMKQFLVYIPSSLFEAARIDGCNEIHTFFLILLPTIRSGLAALLMINFMTVWNEFFWALVVIDRDYMRTLPLGLSLFQGQYYTEYGQFFAMALLVSLPVIMMFLVFQKYFMSTDVLSGIKG